MRRNTVKSLLTRTDAAAAQQIALDFPAPFDMEHIYRRSLEKYYGTAPARAHAPRIRRSVLQAVTAACLLLTVGLSLGIWTKMQRIATQPPEDPQTAAVTEASTEPSTAAASEPVQTAVPEETAPQPAVIETDAVQPDTAPATEEIPVTEATTMTDAPPAAEVPPATDAPAVPVTESSEETPETALEVTESQGFRIETFQDKRCIVAMEAFPAPTGTLRQCELTSDMVELAEVNETDAVNEYRIRPVGGDTEFIAVQQEYESFSLTVDLDAEISVAIDGRKCFLVVQDDTCTLYWFIDGEGFSVSGRDADLMYLLEISRKLKPVES